MTRLILISISVLVLGSLILLAVVVVHPKINNIIFEYRAVQKLKNEYPEIYILRDDISYKSKLIKSTVGGYLTIYKYINNQLEEAYCYKLTEQMQVSTSSSYLRWRDKDGPESVLFCSSYETGFRLGPLIDD